MLTTKIDIFINEHSDKSLSESKEENPTFILEFIGSLSWDEKFELIWTFDKKSEEMDQIMDLINHKISDFLEQQINQRVAENISEAEYLHHKAIVEVYETTHSKKSMNKKKIVN